jgi:hypothetical protein
MQREEYSMQKSGNPTAERDLPLLLDYERTRHELGDVSVRHLYNLIDRGLLERVKLGRSARITSASIMKLATSK